MCHKLKVIWKTGGVVTAGEREQSFCRAARTELSEKASNPLGQSSTETHSETPGERCCFPTRLHVTSATMWACTGRQTSRHLFNKDYEFS